MFSAVKLVVAGIIVALFGGFLLAGLLGTGPREEIAPAAESASLTPTGIEILSRNAWGPATHGLVADGEGILWALEHPGRLVRLDPATDTTTMWTLADDITFGRAHTIAASDSGGVWLVGADEVRLFDGDRFTQVIEAPEPLARAVEADDASLWATSEHGAVLHWDGSTWANVGPKGPGEDYWYWVLALEVDSAGRPWIGGAWCPVDLEGECSPEVLVFDGSEWTRFDESDAMPLGGLPQSIKQMPDGSIWVATEGGLARFDGTAWTAESPVPGALYQSLAASPDGTVWASSNVDSARVWRSDGTDWAVYGKAEGLPSLDWSAILAIVGDRVFLGTDAGTYQRKGDGWVPAWDVVALGLDTPRLLATGGDELWVVEEKGAWHGKSGTWTDGLAWTHLENLVHDVALGPDGTVWIAGPDGIAYRDSGRWEFIDERAAGAVAVDGEGTVWAAGFQDGCMMLTLREEGGTWVRQNIFLCPIEYGENLSLVVDGDGTVWLGARCPFGGGLVRYTGGGWEAIEEIDGTEVRGGIVLGAGADGAMWVLAQECHVGDGWPSLLGGWMARFDGGEVSTIELPAGASASDGALGADGMPWTGSDRGPAHFDGQTWQFPYEDLAIPDMQVAAVDPDGSVYGTIGAAILRLPPRPVAPAAESS